MAPDLADANVKMPHTREGSYARFWCVNFDAKEVLQHGLRENFWAMQYQYSHGGHVYQGSAKQRGATTKNLRAAVEVKVGDWLVAYLKPKTFYAVSP